MWGICSAVAASSESLLGRLDMARVTRGKCGEIARSPQLQTSSPASCQGLVLQRPAFRSRLQANSGPITRVDAQDHSFAVPWVRYTSMQEDRQPNETRIQRKGDHRVPKVRSSVNLGRFLHRYQSRLSHPPQFRQTGKSQHKKWNQRRSGPRSRDSNHSQDKPATNRRLTTDSVSIHDIPGERPKLISCQASKPLPQNDPRLGPSLTTPPASGTLLAVCRHSLS